MQDKAESDLLTVSEAARLLSIKETTLRQWIWLREIRYFKLKNKAIRIHRDDVARIIAEGEKPALTKR